MRGKRSPNDKSWNKEYAKPEHLRLSTEPGEDFLKFLRFLERHHGREYLNPLALAVDIGCGNGRHLIHLAKYYAMRGIGYDISKEAISQALAVSQDLPITYGVRSIAGTYPDVADESVSIVLDLMSSHVLRSAEREVLRGEIYRILKPGGWLILKTFMAEEDINTRRLLRDHPAEEEGAYIHPGFGVYEYVWTIPAIKEFYGPYFTLEKIEKSYKHIIKGRAGKRRTVTVYMRKG